ncbi:MAG: DUF4412 domain-containing protein [Chitinophagales bacterium]
MKCLRKVYLLAVVSMSMLLFSSCNKTSSTKEGDENDQKEIFYGKVVYTSVIEAGDTLLENTLSSLSPEKVEVYFGQNKFRLIEYGGLSKGNVIIYLDQKEVWQLDTAKKLAWLGEYSDFSTSSPELQDILPDHYAPTVESTGINETVAGIECIKYKIIRSGIIPASDEAHIWVAENIHFPPSRFDIQTEINYITVPAPLLIGYTGGAIMRLHVKGKSYERTIEVASIEKNNLPAGIFDIPSDYQKK